MRFAYACAVLGLVACASTPEKNEAADDDELVPEESLAPGRGEIVPNVRYEDTAAGNFARAEQRFEDEDYLAAQRYYGYIRRKYPYSRFSVLADLRIADCLYGRQRYIEAVDSYQNFIRLHPTHEKVGYARYKVGKAYYEQVPGEWFLLPPAHEKDQTAVRDAERALKAYVDQHQGHENFEEADGLLKDVRSRMMAHERYAADFYEHLGRDRAYVGRLELIRKDYADVGLDDDLLLEIARVYARLEDVPKTKDAVDELVAKFPKSPLRKRAEELLAKAAQAAEKPAPEQAGPVDAEAASKVEVKAAAEAAPD